MCTLTIIPAGRGGMRIAFNRDESRLRTQALPPRVVCAGDRAAMMPVDPASGGTWIAANDAGLIFAITNLTPKLASAGRTPLRQPGQRSRGHIIPSLIGYGSLAEAVLTARRIDVAAFAPFRLVIISHEAVHALEHVPGESQSNTFSPDAPLLFTSSGLGDALVQAPRRALFDKMLAASASPSAQDAFHSHRWPERPHLSVCMSRDDARTVSYTVIQLDLCRAIMNYFVDSPDQPVPPATCSLDFFRRPAALAV